MALRNLSLKTQSLLLVVPLTIAFMLIILWSQHLINTAANNGLKNLQRSNTLSFHIQTIRTDIKDLESLIYQYAISTSDELKMLVDEHAEKFRQSVQNLANANKYLHLDNNAENPYQQHINELLDSEKLISKLLLDYEDILGDAYKRYPGLQYLNEKLLPANVAFLQAVDQAFDEVRVLNNPSLKAQYNKLLVDIRYAWTQQIGWFRMFIANRSGIFGKSESSMIANLHNRDVYIGIVKDLLEKIKRIGGPKKSSAKTLLSLDDMLQSFVKYNEQFDKAKQLYLSKDWRTDNQFLVDKMKPALLTAYNIASAISDKINADTSTTLTESYVVAENITHYMWYFAAAILFLLIATYIAFDKLIEQPIKHVVKALDAEASGEASLIMPKAHSTETHQLINAFHNMREQVHSRQTRLKAILDNVLEGIITFDETGTIETVNNAAETLFGYTAEELIGKNINLLTSQPEELKHDESAVNNSEFNEVAGTDIGREVEAIRKDGTTFPMSIKVSEMYLSGKKYFTAIVDDVSQRKAMIDNLRRLAEHDSLTNLYNRFYFSQELERVVKRISRSNSKPAALLYIDLDNFKYVNDTLGHLAGDQLLIEVSMLLKNRLRDSDMLARLGGDEFAVLLYNVNTAEACEVAEKLRMAMHNYSFKNRGSVVDIGCSIGVAMITKQIKNMEELFAQADFSCHIAKSEGRNRVHVYTQEDREQIAVLSDDIGWTRRIKKAIADNHLVLAYQPIQRINSRETANFELLVRMVDEHGKIIMPAGFIPPAERFGLIGEIDRWVINQAITLLEAEHRENPKIGFSINISAQSFEKDELLKFITARLQASNVAPESLTFEITETMAMADINLTAKFLQALQDLGCKTALDDFGSGYSSFAYLKELPANYVKIDGAFVKDIHANTLNRAIVKSMNDVAQAMGKQTIAEFVENEQILGILETIGVNYVQGYHIGKPYFPEHENQRLQLTSTLAPVIPLKPH